MTPAGIRALVEEARRLGSTVTADEHQASVGPIGVSGVLAEQLAKELSAGADAGAVVVGGFELVGRAEVLVRIVAGDPTPEDDALVRAADRRDVPAVVVQLWPQADWTQPFVLSPFVVECRAGEGFPVGEIAARIGDAADAAEVLAARLPVIADAIRSRVVKRAVIRAALLGLAGSRSGASRPLLTLEQIRMLSQIRTISGAAPAAGDVRARAIGVGAVAGAGFAFRAAARSLRTILPGPVANSAVAAAGTWVLARAYAAAEERLPTS
ncbi:MAG TPA: hypothetical protein VFU99_06840 [Gaiellaceae bacterium]|nr:hypothetical protein [Gaiellaceae bacterium]